MNEIFLYLLLLAAVGFGWWLGRKSFWHIGSSSSRAIKNLPVKDYFIGLNYLLNDEPDDAIDIFINSLEVNSNTIETHMALGTLLRRRGKVDRSIGVYQDLLGKSGFSHEEVNEIKINLVQSYIAAGLLDRAESLLEELRKEKGSIKIQALIHSANVYQLEKDWEKGVNALTELLRFCSPQQRQKYQHLASHFYSELAEIELNQEHFSKTREYLQLAAAMDKSNPRVSILGGQLESRCENYSEAIKSYLRVKKQSPSFMAEVFYPLIDCYKKSGKDKKLEKFIDSCIQEENNAAILLGLADYLNAEKGEDVSRKFLLDQLKLKPSLRLLLKSMTLELEDKNACNVFETALNTYIESKAHYQCENCGFELKSLHWQCPSCSQWGTVKHVRGILGE